MSVRHAPVVWSPPIRALRTVLRHSPLAWLMIGFVRMWRAVVSPLYGDVCKFYPSCSSYGLTALETHGAIRGGWLTLRRLVRCHPWSLGGYDPVPGSGHTHHSPTGAHDPSGSLPDASPASAEQGSQR